jgi:hypothetical protein
MYTLGSMSVHWFPAEWTLSQRKQREKFALVVNNVLAEVHDTILWSRNKPHEFLAQFNTKSYKAIKMAKGDRLIIGFFEKLEDLVKVKKMTFQLHGKDYQWNHYSPPSHIKKMKGSFPSKSSKNEQTVGRSHKLNKNKKLTPQIPQGQATSKQKSVIVDILKLLLSI